MTLIYETMHECMKILPKYMLKYHLGPTTQTQTQTNTMGHSPIKKNEKIWEVIEIFPTPFKITPTLEILESKA